MSQHTYRIKGMHCASCASIIERSWRQTPGVESVAVNYGTETAQVTFDEAKVSHEKLSAKIKPLGYDIAMPSAHDMGMSEDEHAAHLGLKQSKAEKLAEIASLKTKIIIAIPLAIFSIILMAWDILAAR